MLREEILEGEAVNIHGENGEQGDDDGSLTPHGEGGQIR
jgi:hypothetical protein